MEWTEADIAELCSRPEYSGSDYCRLHEPGESPAEFNERRLAEDGAPLEVEITEGQRAGVPWAPLALAVAAGVALAAWTGRR